MSIYVMSIDVMSIYVMIIYVMIIYVIGMYSLPLNIALGIFLWTKFKSCFIIIYDLPL